MERVFDVVVIGGGIAGSAAALAAAAVGARVVLVRASPGATALSSGGWNGPLPEPIGGALERAGLAHLTCDGPLPHPAGELRACTFAPATHAAARVDDDAVICGIAGLAAFHAPALASLWRAPGEASAHITVSVDGTPPAGWSPVALAAHIERDPAVLARPLAAALRGTAHTRVILPAVLGLEDVNAVVAALHDATGIQIAEALGVSPSVPGWRLGRALDRGLRESTVEIIAGRATRAGNGVRHLERVRVSDHQAEIVELVGATFVLATGKFVGGGIAADGDFRETALDCPVWIDHLGQRFDGADPIALTNAERGARQPLLEAGVRSDAESRPVDANDDVAYDNVFIAGAVRAGVATDTLGLGTAAADGLNAGAQAARIAQIAR